MNLLNDDEDESIWSSNPMKIDISKDEEEEKLGIGGTILGPKIPTPIPTPIVAPSIKTPKILGECCKRMENELLQKTNILKWTDMKEKEIIVFSHTINKILNCPWCGQNIP